MTDRTAGETGGRDDRLDWRWVMALGVLLILGGIFALANPFAASLAVEITAAVFFVAGGVMQLWMAFTGKDHAGSRVASGMLGGLLVVFGLLLLASPIAGLISLTLLVASFFLAMGVVRTWIGLRRTRAEGRAWTVASGLVSIALAVLIFFALPEGAAGLLGIFLGVDLVMGGAASIAGALQMRRA